MKRNFRPLTFFIALFAVIAARKAGAQISITSGVGLTYGQDFDNLTRSTTAENWTDNASTTSTADSPRLIGLSGWYLGNFGTTTVTPQIRAGTGSLATGSFYSFGTSAAADRALGTLPSDSAASASMRIGARFVNNTGDLITGFTFSYDGEQWRLGGVTDVNNQFVVAYALFAPGAGSLNSVDYSGNIAGATFNTPSDGNGTGAALDGNALANRVAGLGGTITDLAVMPGDEIWLRWFDSNSSGADHGLGIDNFTVTFTTIPEPSSVALMVGGLTLLFWRFRRSN